MSPVKDFYKNKTILITGASGHLGIFYLYKLLSLGVVKEILLLIRAKKGRSCEDRLQTILDDILFEKVDKKQNLRIIEGDIELNNLGISVENLEYVKENVDIIIHNAATVNFNEQLNKAISINVLGTKTLLDISSEIRNLECFMYISTAYSNCHLDYIEEKLYKTPVDYKTALKFLDTDEDEVNTITDKLIHPWPNTYTFTKSITEDMVMQYKNLPVIIIRPSIVVPSSKEYPGYIKLFSAPCEMLIGITVGMIRVIYGDPEVSMNAIPIDIVINGSLLVAAVQNRVKDDVPIYNIVGNDRMSINSCKLNFCFFLLAFQTD
jgi:alcohol-forming fatty acyl-CoA reductase